jgi:hypothetical protein
MFQNEGHLARRQPFGVPDRRAGATTVGVTVALATLASLAGSVAAHKLDPTAPAAVWFAAIAGAAVPPLISTMGPWHSLRAGAALVVMLVAVLVTYGTATTTAAAAGKPSIFELPEPPPPPPPDAGLHVEVRPESVQCTGDGCPDVTVTSTGTKTLVIGDIELTGEDAGDFGYDRECEDRRLHAGESCTVRLTFDPGAGGGTRQAQLVIHQNLPGPASYVSLEAVVEGSTGGEADIALSVGSCRVRDGRLTVSFRVEDVGDVPYEGRTTVAARRSGDRLAELAGVPVGERQSLRIGLDDDDYGTTFELILEATPESDLAEPTGNNTAAVSVDLPAEPAGAPAGSGC